ncbi:MAG: cation diffusion facilitator family transporter [Candidatus Hydrothermae bacterium]|nr:cation diffusion facilitator family transporter [Candidatus Hydrothermae bacterium]
MEHHHAHGHAHPFQDPRHLNRAFALGVILNFGFVLVEAGVGLSIGSLALISDAGHNFSDVLSLLLAWGGALLAQREPTERHTYGLRKATIMASLISAVLLLVALGGIVHEAIHRLWNPKPVEGMSVMVVASIGVVINTFTALLFLSGQKHDLNIRGAFLHMAADAGVSLAVVLGGGLMMLTGWPWVDPVLSLGIVGVIFWATWGLLRESVNLSLDAVPENIDLAGIRAYLTGLEPVARIHDLHVWPLSTTESALTVHLVVHKAPTPDTNTFLSRIQQELFHRFGIHHATIQIEYADRENGCMLDPACM